LPLFIVSFLITIILINYFTGNQYPILVSVNKEVMAWANIVTGVGVVFANAYLWLLHGGRLIKRKGSSKELFGSLVFWIFYIGVWILGLTYSFTGTFSTVYIGLVSLLGAGTMTLKWSGHMYGVYVQLSRIRRVESLVFFIAWIISVFNELNVVVYFIPQVAPAAEWFYSVPNVAVMRGSLLAAGLGAVILGVRSLVQREPGLVEVEV
jgi:hypothetical protein